MGAAHDARLLAPPHKAQRLVHYSIFGLVEQARLTDALASLASAIDHASGKVVLRLTRPRTRCSRQRLPLDIEVRVFHPGKTATTLIAQIACTLRQVSDEPAYDLIVGCSLAQSFYAWLAESAAEYGYEVR